MTGRSILVHGGAWATPDAEIEPHREGVRLAAEAGWAVLSGGGSALDAVAEAVRLMEADPAFNAGRGAVLNEDGEVELDAAIMDGATLSAGAVAAVRRVAHPILLARRVMESSPHVLLVAEGALAFARSEGLAIDSPADLIVPRERSRWEAAVKEQSLSRSQTAAPLDPTVGGTVGAVARDGDGHLAAATSTGGSILKRPGRVGDSPLVGCGLYADDRSGAASSTGWGEGIIRVVLARRGVELLGLGKAPPEAAREAIGMLESRVGGRGGIILADGHGRLGFAFNTPHMATAYWSDGMTEPAVAI